MSGYELSSENKTCIDKFFFSIDENFLVQSHFALYDYYIKLY